MRQLRKTLAVVLVLLSSLGLAAVAQQLLLAARPAHGLDSDSWQMTTAYWLATNETLSFSLEPGAQALRLLSNAISDQSLDTADYSLQLDFRDQANRHLKQLTFAHRAHDSRRQRRLSSLGTTANRDAYTTEQTVLGLHDVPGAAELRITLRSRTIAGIGLRSYWRQQRRENRLTSTWQRLHQDKRERLAAANVLPVGYLKPEESRNLMRFRWRPLAPLGVATKDYQVATLFEPKQPEPEQPTDTSTATATGLRISAYAMTADALQIPWHQSSQPIPLRLDLRLPLPNAVPRHSQRNSMTLRLRAWSGQRLTGEWQDQFDVVVADDEWLVANPQRTLSGRVQRYVDIPPKTDRLEIEATEGSLLSLYNRPAQAPFLDLRSTAGPAPEQPIYNWQSLDRRLIQRYQPQRQLIARRPEPSGNPLTTNSDLPMAAQSLFPTHPRAAISVLLPLSRASERPAEQRYRRLPAGQHSVHIAADSAVTEPRLLITGSSTVDTLSISSRHNTLLQLPAGSGIGRAPLAGLAPGQWDLRVEPGAGQQLFLSHGGGPEADDTAELYGERLVYPLKERIDFLLPPACCAAGSVSVRLFAAERASAGTTIVLSELLGGRRRDQLSGDYTTLQKRSELTLKRNPVVAMLTPGQPSLTHQAVITLPVGTDLAVDPQQLSLTVEDAAGPLYVSAVLHRPERDVSPLKLEVAQR